MAKAQAEYTLHLSADEARVLADILKFIGGNPDSTRRGLCDGIMYALKDAGMYVDGDVEDVSPKHRCIDFLKPKEE